MTVRRMRFFLWLSTGAAGAAGAAVVAWAVLPLNPLGGEHAPRTANFTAESASSGVQPERLASELQNLAQISLRRPLHDAPQAPAAPEPVQSNPPLEIRVTGTIYEPGHCRAMIQLPDGTTQLKSVGESAGDARILDIQNGSVKVEYFGKSLVLTVPKTEGS
jgi:hypothetical protein